MGKKIIGVKAAGQNIVVEMLDAQEASCSALHLPNSSKLEAPQAYIVSIGPLVDVEKHGLKVGDRILFSGMMTPLPKNEENGRQRGAIDAFAIKSILEEESLMAA